MAASSRLAPLNPQKLWLVMTISGMLLLVMATVGGIFIGLRQNQSIVQSENKMMLRRNGELLTHQNIRTFVESLGFDERHYRIQIQSALDPDHRTLEFGKLNIGNLTQCSTEFYFQYQVELCRPLPISWPTIAGVFAVLLAIIGAVSLLVRKLGLEIVASFQKLFSIAKIQAPVKMNFNEAWNAAFSMAESFNEFQLKLVEAEKSRAVLELSRQVAHDIRSPLTALNFLAASLDDVAPEKKNLVRSAIKRIEDIANDLLEKSRQKASLQNTNVKDCVAQVIQEKRLEFHNRKDLTIEFVDQAAEILVSLSNSELARILSNLVNNSIEAKGTVLKFELVLHPDHIELSLTDNGVGIAPEFLSRIGEANFTLGKNGNGLGVFHAKSTLESAGGKLQIESIRGKSTIVKLILPKA